jgi:hypothetical protein
MHGFNQSEALPPVPRHSDHLKESSERVVVLEDHQFGTPKLT